MRPNTRKVLDAWFAGKPERETVSIWTDGSRIFSYETVLAEHVAETLTVRLNMTKYSHTTTVHQNSIRAEMLGTLYEIVEYVDVPKDAKNFPRPEDV